MVKRRPVMVLRKGQFSISLAVLNFRHNKTVAAWRLSAPTVLVPVSGHDIIYLTAAKNTWIRDLFSVHTFTIVWNTEFQKKSAVQTAWISSFPQVNEPVFKSHYKFKCLYLDQTCNRVSFGYIHVTNTFVAVPSRILSNNNVYKI